MIFLVLRTLDRGIVKTYGPMNEATAHRVYDAARDKHPTSKIEIVRVVSTYDPMNEPKGIEAALSASADKPLPASIAVRLLTCGCCTGGCTCLTHADIPNGRPVHLCAHHSPFERASVPRTRADVGEDIARRTEPRDPFARVRR